MNDTAKNTNVLYYLPVKDTWTDIFNMTLTFKCLKESFFRNKDDHLKRSHDRIRMYEAKRS